MVKPNYRSNTPELLHKLIPASALNKLLGHVEIYENLLGNPDFLRVQRIVHRIWENQTISKRKVQPSPSSYPLLPQPSTN